MKYKHIQAAHEIRMWAMTIVSAIGTLAAIDAAHPEYKEAIKAKFRKRPLRAFTKEEIRDIMDRKIKIVVVDREEES